MALTEYKTIFWFEFFHRLLARFLELWFALPLRCFWLRGAIPSQLCWPLLDTLHQGGAVPLLSAVRAAGICWKTQPIESR